MQNWIELPVCFDALASMIGGNSKLPHHPSWVQGLNGLPLGHLADHWKVRGFEVATCYPC